MKENAIGIVAICQECHHPFEVNITGDGYTCFECQDRLTDEPKVREWEDVSTPDQP